MSKSNDKCYRQTEHLWSTDTRIEYETTFVYTCVKCLGKKWVTRRTNEDTDLLASGEQRKTKRELL